MHDVLFLACIVAAIAAVFDWRSGKIPNVLTLGILVAAPVAHVWSHHGDGISPWVYVGAALLGAVVCSFVPALLAAKRIVGGGDVKLFACLGAVLGVRIGIEVAFYSFAIAALVGPARLAFDGRLFRSMRDAVVVAVRPGAPVGARGELLEHLMTRFTLGPAVFVGTVVTAWLHWRAV